MLLARGSLDDEKPQVFQVNQECEPGVWTWENSEKSGLSVCLVGHTMMSCEAMWRRYRKDVIDDPSLFLQLKNRVSK